MLCIIILKQTPTSQFMEKWSSKKLVLEPESLGTAALWHSKQKKKKYSIFIMFMKKDKLPSGT